ncbi:MAG TPA: glycosyltransferase [Pyrinomonadaceae bacterium]|nr:glycosyltransferase [Pyrinomonadaceae bacterium]
MKKVAIIVQRCHESIVGGSEALAWQYAMLLKDAYEVDVLTTTAVDAAYWTNVLPLGLEVRDGVNIRRFHVDIGYSEYRTDLWTRMLRDFAKFGTGNRADADEEVAADDRKALPWTISFQEELVRNIGPHSISLCDYLRRNWPSYRTIIFVTYLYPTAYFGLMEVPKGRALFAPTLHDELPAYLSVYKHAARHAHSIIWLTDAERRLGQTLWGEVPGRVVAMAIDAKLREPFSPDAPYVLYCGRIDPNKGCGELFDYFIRFKAENPSPLRLVLTGKDDIPVPDHPEIDFRGFVSSEEKFSLMAGALLYIMPSSKESFSIVTLEAMSQRTPVLVTSASEVLSDHVRQSGGGRIYHNYESFAAELNEMLNDESLRAWMGKLGREYVVSRYTPERVRQSLLDAVESCPAPEEAAQVMPRPEPHPAPPAPKKRAQEPTPVPHYAPPLPLPRGWELHQLQALVYSVLVEDAPPEEMKAYATADFERFIHTLGLIPDREGLRILELGANPYFTTVLLTKFRDARLHLANFFGGRDAEGTQKVFVGETNETFAFSYKQFNAERDLFPYPDDTFDVVLFCEIIEHLLSDPVHALVEIRRVLKPGGILILTTPNVARLENARKAVAGENIYDPYSGYGPYGRHNREYTQQDLFELLSANGFTVGTMFTADVNEHGHEAGAPLSDVLPILKRRQTDLGQYIFCQSTVNRESKRLPAVRPARLYRSMPQEPDADG